MAKRSHGKLNMDAVLKQAKEIKAEQKKREENWGNGGDIIKKPFPKPGDYYFWLCPPWKDGLAFPGKYAGTHWQIPDKNGNKKVFSCAANMSENGICPICDVLLELATMNVDISRMSESSRYYINAIPLKEDPETGELYADDPRPKVYPVAPTIRDKLIMLMSSPRILDVTDPNAGFPIRVNRPESFQGGNQYTVTVVEGYTRCRIPIKDGLEVDEFINSLLDQLHDLDKIIKDVDDEMMQTLESAAREMAEYYRNSEDIVIKYGDGYQEEDAEEEEEEEAPLDPDDEDESEEEEESQEDETEGEAEGEDEYYEVIEVAGEEFYLIEEGANGLLVLEDDDENTKYACAKCKKKIYTSEKFAVDHIEKHDKPKPAKKKKAAKKKLAAKKSGGVRKVTTSSGLEIPVDCEHFGNHGNDELCPPRKRKVCAYANICKENSE